MVMQQINLKIPMNLFTAVQKYVEHFGYRNVQEFALESIREKVFEKEEYDESFSAKEIELIDNLVDVSIKKNLFGTEDDLDKALK